MNPLFPTKIYEYDSLESSNETLKDLYLQDSLPEGTIVIAHAQSKGKGQRGKKWESEAGKNLLFTLLLRPKKMDYLYLLNMTIAVSIKQCLQKQVSAENQVSIKWPNDVLIDGKKVAGVLIENKIVGNIFEASFIGIGINVNQAIFPKFNRAAISVKNVLKKELDLKVILKDLLDNISANYLMLKSDSKSIVNLYLKSLYLKHKLSNFLYKGTEIQMTIIGVNEIGQLCLQDRNGMEIEVNQGEIEFRRFL